MNLRKVSRNGFESFDSCDSLPNLAARFSDSIASRDLGSFLSQVCAWFLEQGVEADDAATETVMNTCIASGDWPGCVSLDDGTNL